MTVRGPAAIAALCARCLVVLVAVNVPVIVAVQLVQDPSALAGQGWSQGLAFLWYVLLVATIPVALVGFPAGMLTARLLRPITDERAHVGVFALVGAVLSVAICAWVGVVDTVGVPALLAAAEGAVGAGGARWWSGRTHARRASRRRVPSDEEVEDRLVDVAQSAPEPVAHAEG